MSWLEAIVWYYGSVSLCTLAAYAWDKTAAKRRGATRIRERTLHLWALVGGFGGSLLGQHVLRHKTRHTSFIAVTWLALTLHAGFWVWRCMRGQMP